MAGPKARLTTTKQDILAVLSSRPEEKFFVNELIRLTNRFPNSVEVALKELIKDGLVRAQKTNQRKFYQINPSRLSEIEEQIPKVAPFDWVKLLNRETSYAFNITLCHSNLDDLPRIYGANLPTFWTNSFTFGVYYLKHELAKVAKAISSNLEYDPEFGRRDATLCRQNCDRLVNFTKNLSKINFRKLSSLRIAEYFSAFSQNYQNVFPFLVTPHIIERYFEQTIRNGLDDENVISTLLSPTSTVDKELDSSLKLASFAKKNGFTKEFEDLLDEHHRNFCWLSLWTLRAEPLSKEHFLEEVKNILEKIAEPRMELKRLRREELKRKTSFEETLKEVRLSQTLENKVRLLQEYISLRTYRKNAISQAHYYHLPLLYETAKRLSLSREDAKLLSYNELIDGLTKKISVAELKKSAQSRKSGWSVLMWYGKIDTITGTRRILETLEQFRIMTRPQPSSMVIRGTPACRGRVIARVKIVHKLSELSKVQNGDILVTKMTTPDYITGMRRCVGIITDEGGVTCHAAIVSREFNIPCVVATHYATKILKDNDLVELNANKGVIRTIEKSPADHNTREIKGESVQPGRISGRAVVVLDANDFSKVRAGDILITLQPTPDFLSSLYRVSGMIIEEDSLTSHGVLYAQSLRIPTIMGAIRASEIITDGEQITLDGSSGVILRHQP